MPSKILHIQITYGKVKRRYASVDYRLVSFK